MEHFKLTLLVFFVLLVSIFNTQAQKQKNVWCFGEQAEVNFNSGVPVCNTTCSLSTSEGCSSIADKNTGALLFYTDGTSVYNVNNQVMPGNTVPLGGNSSTTQSALIVPVPGSDHLYYIFCTVAQVTPNYDNQSDSGTEYCIIDMNLDGGLGDVSQQPRLLLQPTTEKIAAAPMSQNQGFWVVLHLWNSDAFYAYPVTAGGIGTPVISHAGVVHANLNGCCGNDDAIGYMRISPNGTKIAVAIDYNLHLVQVLNFNDITGVIAGVVFTDNTVTGLQDPEDTTGPYGLCFSPNSQYLYVASDEVNQVYQYDMQAGNANAILASRTPIGGPEDTYYPWGMQTGPDGKIYISTYSEYLDCISNPNAGGHACAYQQEAVNLGSNYGYFGLPELPNSFVSVCQAQPVTIQATQNTICASDSASICASPGFTNYQWSSSDTGICIKVNQPGTYSVTATNFTGCIAISDSVVISVYPIPDDSIIAAQTAICGTDSIQLCGPAGYSFYQWNNGETANCIKVHETGSYYVTVIDSNACRDISNKVTITASAGPPDSIMANQNIFCPNDSAQICAPGGYPSYQWNVGINDSCITVTLPGDYYVTVTDANGCSAVSNRINISEYASPPVSTSILHDTLHVYNAVSCQWYLDDTTIPGATDSIYIVKQQGIYSVAITDSNGCTAISNGEFVSGINNLLSQVALKLYPDPASDELNIAYILKQTTSLQITLTDLTGRWIQDVVNEKQGSGRYLQKVNISNLSAGVYMINFASENGSVVLRFEKQ